jgi:uncharacterized protein YdgA (DUF945 family)
MKKFGIIGAVLVLALLITPWGIGQLAANRIERGLDDWAVRAPFLEITERSYRSGWFNSDLKVTFELFPGLGRVAGDTESRRFTVHNDIRHGPILGSGIGLARIKSRLDLSEETRKELAEALGSGEPFDVTTIIGFSGSARTVVSAEARKLEKESGSMSWEPLRLVYESSANGDTFTLDGQWPGIEGRSGEGGDVAFRGMRISGGGKRIVGELFDTDVNFSVDEVRVSEESGLTEIKNAHYIAVTEPRGEFVDVGIKLGCGALKSKEMNLTEAHYDFSLLGLHAATVDKLVVAMESGAGSDEEAVIREQMLELLKHDPTFRIDRISFATEEGAGVLKGTVKLKGVTAQDMEAGAAGLIVKVVADLDFDVEEPMLVKFVGGVEQIEAMVKEGFIERKDGHLVSKIAFQEGKLLVNGKEQALPGIGGPPPESMSPEDSAPEE